MRQQTRTGWLGADTREMTQGHKKDPSGFLTNSSKEGEGEGGLRYQTFKIWLIGHRVPYGREPSVEAWSLGFFWVCCLGHASLEDQGGHHTMWLKGTQQLGSHESHLLLSPCTHPGNIGAIRLRKISIKLKSKRSEAVSLNVFPILSL